MSAVAAISSPATPAPATTDRFGQCIGFTWRPENDGQPYHVTPGDHGGPTAWGVTLTAFQAWRVAHHATPPGPVDLRSVPRSELATLIRANYWNAVQADHLPPGADLLVYEFGFGSGPGTSARQLQRVLNTMGADLPVDGSLGPRTLAAAGQADRRTLIGGLGATHAAFYRSLDQPMFVHGWLRRNADRLSVALQG